MRKGNLVLGLLLVLMAFAAMTWSVSACEQSREPIRDSAPLRVETSCREIRPLAFVGLSLLFLGGTSLALVPVKEGGKAQRELAHRYAPEADPLMVIALRRIPSHNNG